MCLPETILVRDWEIIPYLDRDKPYTLPQLQTPRPPTESKHSTDRSQGRRDCFGNVCCEFGGCNMVRYLLTLQAQSDPKRTRS